MNGSDPSLPARGVPESIPGNDKRFEALFEQAGVGLVHVESATGRFLRVNQRFCDIVGYGREELQGSDLQRITHPEDLAGSLSLLAELSEGRSREGSLENRYLRKDGGLVWVSVQAATLSLEEGPSGTHISMVQDITARKEAEAASAAREAEFQAAFEQGGMGLAQISGEGRFLRVNRKLCEVLGYEPGELIGRAYGEFTHPDDLELSSIHFQDLVEGRKDDYRLQKRYVRKDGRVIWVDLSVRAIRDAAGGLNHLFSAFHDVTQRMEMEESLKRSERQFRTLAENLPFVVSLLDRGHRYLYINPAVEEAMGRKAADFLGRTDQELGLPEPFVDRWNDRLRALFERAEEQTFEFEFPSRVGPRVFSATLVPVVGRQGLVDTALGVAMDVTERRLAERSLKASEALHRSLFENMLNGFAYCRMLYDGLGAPQDFIYLDVNRAFGSLTGLTDVVGKRVSEVVPGIREADPGLFQIYGRVALTGVPEKFEMYVAALSKWFSVSVYCPRQEHFVAVFDVINERKRAEEAVRQQMEELRRWHEATLGRESRVLELKREVNALQIMFGQAPRYDSAGDDEPGGAVR